jgi:hypothetical protein
MKNKTQFNLILAYLFLSLSLSANGQVYNYKKPHYIDFKINQEDSYRELSYKIDKIIDSTGSNGSYGYVIKGLNQTRREVKFTNGLTYQFQNFITNFSLYNPYGKSLVMVIDELKVSKASDIAARKNPGVIIIRFKYFSRNEILFQETITKPHKKGSHENKIYQESIQNALEASLNKLEKHIVELKKAAKKH